MEIFIKKKNSTEAEKFNYSNPQIFRIYVSLVICATLIINHTCLGIPRNKRRFLKMILLNKVARCVYPVRSTRRLNGGLPLEQKYSWFISDICSKMLAVLLAVLNALMTWEKILNKFSKLHLLCFCRMYY